MSLAPTIVVMVVVGVGGVEEAAEAVVEEEEVSVERMIMGTVIMIETNRTEHSTVEVVVVTADTGETVGVGGRMRINHW